MRVGQFYKHDNIMFYGNSIVYMYEFTPFNSVHVSDKQKNLYVKKLNSLLCKVNMNGCFFRMPVPIFPKDVKQTYVDIYKEHGNRDLANLAVDWINDITTDLEQHPRFQTRCFLLFVDGRPPINKKLPVSLLQSETKITKKYIQLATIVNSEIEKCFSDLSIECKRTQASSTEIIDYQKVCDMEDVEHILNYIDIPTLYKAQEYYIEEHAEHLTYHYKTAKMVSSKPLYTKTLVMNENKVDVLNDHDVIDVIYNDSDLNYPLDIFIKFDLIPSKKFIQYMSGKKHEIGKARNRRRSSTERKNKQDDKAFLLANIGSEVDEQAEEFKVRWQLFTRVRANSIEHLNQRTTRTINRFQRKGKMHLSTEIGKQLLLSSALFPFKSDYHENTQLTDLTFFSKYNLLGGSFIGDKEINLIENYSYPKGIPIYCDQEKITTGERKTNSLVTAFVGETGSGKTQLADLRAFSYMVFRNYKILCIDPKDDRWKKIKFLGKKATRIRIGDKNSKNGMFDIYVLKFSDNKQDMIMLWDKVRQDITNLAKILKKEQLINFHEIQEAHENMVNKYFNKEIPHMNFTHLIEVELMKINKLLAKELLTFKKDTYGRLFFADEETDYNYSFDLTNSYNIVSFYKLPVNDDTGEFSPTAQENALFSLLTDRLFYISEDFMKDSRNAGNGKMAVVDEYNVFAKIQGGKAIVNQIARMGRTFFTHFSVISQFYKDLDDYIIGNLGQLYAGDLRLKEDIDAIVSSLGLDNNKTIEAVLSDTTKLEGENEKNKYRFLFVDYNNRKDIVRMIIPKTLQDAFRTLKDIKEKKEKTKPRKEVTTHEGNEKPQAVN